MPRSHAWKLPELVQRALTITRAGMARDSVAASLIRAGGERSLFRVRLPARDRRHAEVARLVHAVRLRSF